MRPELVHSKSKPHMNEKGVANLCAQVKYAQDVASSRTVRDFLGLCRAVQHENDQELSSEGTANSWLFMYRQEKKTVVLFMYSILCSTKPPYCSRSKQSQAISSAYRHNELSAATNIWLGVEWPVYIVQMHST